MAGHSKKNIKIRGKQDAMQGNTFTKLGREIIVAAKRPANPRLRVAVEKAAPPRRARDRAPAVAGADYDEIVYEEWAGGAAMLRIRNRTVAGRP